MKESFREPKLKSFYKAYPLPLAIVWHPFHSRVFISRIKMFTVNFIRTAFFSVPPTPTSFRRRFLLSPFLYRVVFASFPHAFLCSAFYTSLKGAHFTLTPHSPPHLTPAAWGGFFILITRKELDCFFFCF